MADIPRSVLTEPLPGLELLSWGKVRESYCLPSRAGQNLMLVVSTDRVSIFDFVLPALVPQKGEVLNALNVFAAGMLGDFCQQDQVARDVKAFLPEGLRDNPELQKRAVVVEQLAMLSVEAIVRLYLTGSGFAAYQRTDKVCGHYLPKGLVNGSRLPYPIFTPTTKAEVGHDQHLGINQVIEKHGFLLERLSLQLTQLFSQFAEECGIILADTKLEWGRRADGTLVLADERFTPDSSRFWDAREYQRALASGTVPPSLDKQYVREWGKREGIHQLDPANSDHVAQVHGLTVPENVLKQTARIYRYTFWRLTGRKLEQFQLEQMGIDVKSRPVKVMIILGSTSDTGAATEGLELLEAMPHVTSSVNIVSCHRNPEVLQNLLNSQEMTGVDVVIAGAGKAAALPGIVKSWLSHRGLNIPVIGVGFGSNEGADDWRAAKLSIEQLPGQPVELDVNGQAYMGSGGMTTACLAAAEDEFLPKAVEKKQAFLDYDWRGPLKPKQ